jgi:hypothetical protein
MGEHDDVELSVRVLGDQFRDVSHQGLLRVARWPGRSEVDEHMSFGATGRPRIGVLDRDQEAVAEAHLIHPQAHPGRDQRAHQISPDMMEES